MVFNESIPRVIKVIIITLLIIISVLLTIYFHHFLQRPTVFTHFLYIPIILSALWWGIRGFGVAVFLAILLIISNLFLSEDISSINDYIRSIMFITIGLIVAFLSDRIKAQEQKKNEAIIETGILQKEIMQITEKERQRIGQDLHDGIGQNLTATTFLLEVLREKLKRGKEDINEIEEIDNLIKKSIVQTRSIAKMLSPVEMNKNGLYSAVKEMITAIEKVFDVSCKVSGNIYIEDNQTATHLYYIVREAVTNAIKHGRSKNIYISMSSNKGTELYICDDGIGAQEGDMKSGMGLRIMRYRADMIGADFSADNGRSGGFEVKVKLH
jgi:signal transduction histidine kinase